MGHMLHSPPGTSRGMRPGPTPRFFRALEHFQVSSPLPTQPPTLQASRTPHLSLLPPAPLPGPLSATAWSAPSQVPVFPVETTASCPGPGKAAHSPYTQGERLPVTARLGGCVSWLAQPGASHTHTHCTLTCTLHTHLKARLHGVHSLARLPAHCTPTCTLSSCTHVIPPWPHSPHTHSHVPHALIHSLLALVDPHRGVAERLLVCQEKLGVEGPKASPERQQLPRIKGGPQGCHPASTASSLHGGRVPEA